MRSAFAVQVSRFNLHSDENTRTGQMRYGDFSHLKFTPVFIRLHVTCARKRHESSYDRFMQLVAHQNQ